MYYDFWVKLPEAPGKYVYEKRPFIMKGLFL